MITNQAPQRMYCGDRNVGCGSEITSADLERGACTQCGLPLVAPEFPLRHALLLSLAEVQREKDAKAA